MKHIPENELPANEYEGMYEICRKKNRAFFTNLAISNFIADSLMDNEECSILQFREPLDSKALTLGIKKHFPYSALINHR